MSQFANMYNAKVWPTIIENGAVRYVGEKAAEFGCKKVMLVTDPGLSKLGLADKVAGFIRDAGLECVLFDQVNVDPKDVMVEECAAFGKANGIDGIVGLGGGSSLDTAKGANILMHNEGTINSWFLREDYAPGVPLILIPTTSGTGSENTRFGVISDTRAPIYAKRIIFATADFAICDPELTYDLPVGLTTATAMDAMAHAVEAMTGSTQSYNADVYGVAAIEKIATWLPVVYDDPHNKEGRFQLMLASNLAGQSFNETGCQFGHAASECMGAAFHVTHGISCAWALPETIAFAAVTERDKIEAVAGALGLLVPPYLSNEQVGRMTADAVLALMRRVNMESMKDRGITREALVDIAPNVLDNFNVPAFTRPVTEEEVREILGRMWDTYQ